MIEIVPIKNEDGVISPDLPSGTLYEVLHYDLENNVVSVRIREVEE